MITDEDILQAYADRVEDPMYPKAKESKLRLLEKSLVPGSAAEPDSVPAPVVMASREWMVWAAIGVLALVEALSLAWPHVKPFIGGY